MLRKTLAAIAAAAAIGTMMLVPTDASAGYGYGNRFHGGYGHYGRYYGGFKHAHFYGFRSARFYGYRHSYYGDCWRWVPTRWGYYKKGGYC